jgi:hypothetical protein
MEPIEINIIKNNAKKILKITEDPEEINNPDIYQKINVFITIKNQNLYQKIVVSINILFEFFRVITCSLLILFVPQKCGDHVCSINEKLYLRPSFYSASLIFNFITLFTFCFFYFLEIRRENVLIKYLEVNQTLSYNKFEVEKLIGLLPLIKKKKILQVHKYYQKYANIMIYTYIINVILSGIVISKYSITNQSISTFITYILFIIIKLNNVYSISNTEDFTFYSAYLMTNMQFNDVDKRFKQNQCYDTQTHENTQVMYNMRGML